jgi:hypothetical protein
MAFVEYLRAKGCLRILCIVFAALLLIAVILRIVLSAHINGENMIDKGKLSPAATISTRTEPDGTVLTTMNDPVKHRHIVVADHGWFGKTVDVTEPAPTQHTVHAGVRAGSFGVSETMSNGMVHKHLTTDEPIGIGILFLIAMWPALIVATFLCAPFAKENDGHLEIAFTLPFARERLALSMMAVDTIAILAAELLSVVMTVLCITLFQQPKFAAQPISFALITLALLVPIAWYMMLNAATSSMRRSFGAIIGIAWPVALIVPGLAAITAGGDTLIGQIFHVVMQGLAYLDPLFYFERGGSIEVSSATTIQGMAMDQQLLLGLLAETAMIVVYGALAILQWRRVEA